MICCTLSTAISHICTGQSFLLPPSGMIQLSGSGEVRTLRRCRPGRMFRSPVPEVDVLQTSCPRACSFCPSDAPQAFLRQPYPFAASTHAPAPSCSSPPLWYFGDLLQVDFPSVPISPVRSSPRFPCPYRASSAASVASACASSFSLRPQLFLFFLHAVVTHGFVLCSRWPEELAAVRSLHVPCFTSPALSHS